MRPRLGNQAGQSTVELALVLPVLLTVLLGVVQFALVHHARQVAQTAAHEGARFGAAEGRTATDGADRARNVLRSGLGPSGQVFTISGWETGETVVLDVAGNYPLTIPWMATQGIPLRSTAEVRREGFRNGP